MNVRNVSIDRFDPTNGAPYRYIIWRVGLDLNGARFYGDFKTEREAKKWVQIMTFFHYEPPCDETQAYLAAETPRGAIDGPSQ